MKSNLNEPNNLCNTTNPTFYNRTGISNNIFTTHNMRYSFIMVFISLLLTSCEHVDKVTCDSPSGIRLLQEGIMDNYLEEMALKLASDDYSENKFGWSSFTYNYQEYLKEQTRLIITGESLYYDYVYEVIVGNKNFFSIRHIITESYNEEVNKCSCKATINYGDSSPSTDLEYTFVIDNEDYLHAEYIAESNIVFDDKDYDFNKNFMKGLLNDIKKARKNR